MNKIKSLLVAATILLATSGMAQSIQEGINHLYAKRHQSAKATFEKLLATNPNNLDATYWLGQAHIDMNNPAAARQVYEKALATNGNAPLLLVGIGHVELIEKKKDEARQRFETSISLSKGKKGDDPVILNAIGRAHVDTGDVAYAIEKLKVAAERDPKNPDIFLNLGNAYRKAHEGGQAVTSYQNALALNPNFAVASFRIAKLYETQKNWEIYLQHLNEALAKDPKFAPAYYELYFHSLGKLDFATADDYAKKFIANTDANIQNDYLRAQTAWVRKNYDEAITIAKNIVSVAGAQAEAKNYKLLAYSYLGKGDSITAKQYIDDYFTKARSEEIVGLDYILKADIYSGLPNNPNPNIVQDSYLQAAAEEDTYEKKATLLNQGIERFKAKGKKLAEAELRMALYSIKPNKNPADYFFIGFPFYQGGAYQKADSLFKLYAAAFPDSLYGHYWSAQTNFAMDTTMTVEPYVTNMVTGYQKTLELALVNPRYKSQGITASKVLAGYYNNIKKDKATAIAFLQKGLTLDPTNASIQELLNILQRVPGNKQPARTGGTTGNKPAATATTESGKTSTTKQPGKPKK